MWDNIKQDNIIIIGISGEEVQENGGEKNMLEIFENNVKNFQIFEKDIRNSVTP